MRCSGNEKAEQVFMQRREVSLAPNLTAPSTHQMISADSSKHNEKQSRGSLCSMRGRGSCREGPGPRQHRTRWRSSTEESVTPSGTATALQPEISPHISSISSSAQMTLRSTARTGRGQHERGRGNWQCRPVVMPTGS
ncbi:uncharacterized protein LOC131697379 isoform X1 [Acipenser ruthenus]|uniref:uncharacterized protein LOC131697379 isoform X1 n=1 Tax=Acipenser ruthenus TaxID=7906 RepID=UPI002741D4B8|nr:uncharacterized protein LOC131697379 isoform X1 [Acipenser ruthenus]